MSNVIAFRRVREPYGWLGNMSPHSITFKFGDTPNTWPTAEHLFQAVRFPMNSPIREQIRAERSPMAAKMMAKKYSAQMVVQPRSDQDVGNMRFVLMCKLHEHEALGAELRATGDARIVEDCSARANESGLFWGACRDDRAPGGWWGLNKLGELWMSIRNVWGK
jgi:ribA/ribD-fused uncharacterized protein